MNYWKTSLESDSAPNSFVRYLLFVSEPNYGPRKIGSAVLSESNAKIDLVLKRTFKRLVLSYAYLDHDGNLV